MAGHGLLPMEESIHGLEVSLVAQQRCQRRSTAVWDLLLVGSIYSAGVS